VGLLVVFGFLSMIWLMIFVESRLCDWIFCVVVILVVCLMLWCMMVDVFLGGSGDS